MKLMSLLVTFGVLATGAFAQQTSGPFGLHRGMTREQVTQIIGKGAIKEAKDDRMTVLTVPKPHPAFEYYLLTFSPDEGLLKIVAYGIDIRTNGFGEAVRDSFKAILDPVSQTYGKPDDVFDYVRSGSIWKEPEDWMMGLLKEERTLVAYWTKGPLPNGIHAIAVEASALSTEKGFVTLAYDFDGWGAYLDAKKKKAGTVF